MSTIHNASKLLSAYYPRRKASNGRAIVYLSESAFRIRKGERPYTIQSWLKREGRLSQHNFQRVRSCARLLLRAGLARHVSSAQDCTAYVWAETPWQDWERETRFHRLYWLRPVYAYDSISFLCSRQWGLLPIVAEYLEEESRSYTLVFAAEAPEAWAERVLPDFGVQPKFTKAAFLAQLEIAIQSGLVRNAKPPVFTAPNADGREVPVWPDKKPKGEFIVWESVANKKKGEK